MLQPNCRLSIFICRNKFEFAIFCSSGFINGFKMRLLSFHFCIKVFHSSFKAACRQKVFIADVFHFQLPSGFAGQDHDLAHHIGATQIQSWIRFCITFFLGLLDHFCKWFRSIVMVKNKIQGSRQDSLNLRNGITTSE